MNANFLRPLLGALLLAAPAGVAAGLAVAATAADTEQRLRAAIEAPGRSAENRARDGARHPLETLVFFGIEPDMRVLELWPGRGWYTEILGPYLKQQGRLAVTLADPEVPANRMARDYQAWLEAERERLGAVETVLVDPPGKLDLGPAGTYDAVVTFRNNHTWIRGGYHDAIYAEVFRVLRPGGVLGVVQHRAPEGADAEASAERGYVPEAAVIAAAERAGFELAGSSEVNANPKDTRDHPEGVWTLPPSYRLGEQDRARYEAIGESDRMTLRFVKPGSPGGPSDQTPG